MSWHTTCTLYGVMEQIREEDIPVTDEPPPEEIHSETARGEISKRVVIGICVGLLAVIAGFAIPYFILARRVDKQLASGTFQHAFSFYSAPESVAVGDPVLSPQLANALSHSPVEIRFSNGRVSSIFDRASGRYLGQVELPPHLVANVSDEGRAQSFAIRFKDIPPVLVRAIVSVEDKHFFEHAGFDGPRMAKAVYVDLKQRRKEQGASTISMQLARNLWLGRDKSWKRKVSEVLITMHLERKLAKQQIFEDYCNVVYLGNHGPFGIRGFAEAARAYFNKELNQLTLPEAATLAGIIQRPSYFNPVRYPERAIERRNVVLALMRENKYITEGEYEEASRAPLGLRPGIRELSESQYFLDIAGGQASQALEERPPAGTSNVYTTIDPRLQLAAEQAVADGMQLVDRQLGASGRHGPRPQVALIALDPHTGEVKALCGGRDYASSQLNRILAKRPPGSVFKPFVYTAALNTAITGGSQIFTPASTVVDEPTTFAFDGNRQTYTPANFKNEFRGTVTLRQALAHSLNNATVNLGAMVGFDRVAALAHSAGMNEDIRPTPSVALGAYQVTPLEIAGAYTIFANEGVRVQPTFVLAIHDHNGAELYQHNSETQRVLDPRVAFLMVDMLQEVMRSGTAAGVRARGFTLPAAGKTGTSHDGWFAGFTSKLLCVVWVGFDDYRELGLEGARSALPIWTEFMMNAARYRQYGDVKPFAPPAGVVQVAIDRETGLLAGPYCPGFPSYFIDGTQPLSECAPREVEVNFNEDGGATQREIPDPSPPQLPPQSPPQLPPQLPPQSPPIPRPPLRWP